MTPCIAAARCLRTCRRTAARVFLAVAAIGCPIELAATTSPQAKEERANMAAAAPQLIEQWVASLEGKPSPPWIVRIDDERLTRIFPAHLFYAGHYGEWPLKEGVLPPLTSRNLFVVGPDQGVIHLTDAQGLEDFFRRSVAWSPSPRAVAEPLPKSGGLEGQLLKNRAVEEQLLKNNKARSRDVVYAWLRLSQEFSQDGFFQFSIPDDLIRVDPVLNGLAGSGKAVVVPHGGDFGEISVLLVFSREGAVLSVSECGNVLAGVRPKCQATKLLDADPIVRYMAEQSLLVMGRAAETYIMDQRAKASPELQKEIDRIWAQIVAEGR